MNKFFLFLSFSFLTLTACSESFDDKEFVDENGRLLGFVPYEITDYKIDRELHFLYFSDPYCGESNGKLVWYNEYDENPYSYIYDSKKRSVDIHYESPYDVMYPVITYTYLGSDFPEGSWRYSEASVYGAVGKVFGDGVVETGIAYTGKCFTRDEFRRYMNHRLFLLLNSRWDEIPEDCDKIEILGHKVEVLEWSGDGVEARYTYGDKSCSSKVRLRFKYYEEDCKAAYQEFKDSRADDEDDFEFTYYRTIESNPGCVAEFTKSLKAMIVD